MVNPKAREKYLPILAEFNDKEMWDSATNIYTTAKMPNFSDFIENILLVSAKALNIVARVYQRINLSKPEEL